MERYILKTQLELSSEWQRICTAYSSSSNDVQMLWYQDKRNNKSLRKLTWIGLPFCPVLLLASDIHVVQRLLWHHKGWNTLHFSHHCQRHCHMVHVFSHFSLVAMRQTPSLQSMFFNPDVSLSFLDHLYVNHPKLIFQVVHLCFSSFRNCLSKAGICFKKYCYLQWHSTELLSSCH